MFCRAAGQPALGGCMHCVHVLNYCARQSMQVCKCLLTSSREIVST